MLFTYNKWPPDNMETPEIGPSKEMQMWSWLPDKRMFLDIDDRNASSQTADVNSHATSSHDEILIIRTLEDGEFLFAISDDPVPLELDEQNTSCIVVVVVVARSARQQDLFR